MVYAIQDSGCLVLQLLRDALGLQDKLHSTLSYSPVKEKLSYHHREVDKLLRQEHPSPLKPKCFGVMYWSIMNALSGGWAQQRTIWKT